MTFNDDARINSSKVKRRGATGGIVAGGGIGVAIVVFGVAVLLASRPQLKKSVLVGALLIGAVLLIAGGIAGGVAGQNDREHHGGEEGAPPSATTSGSISLDGSTVGY